MERVVSSRRLGLRAAGLVAAARLCMWPWGMPMHHAKSRTRDELGSAM